MATRNAQPVGELIRATRSHRASARVQASSTASRGMSRLPEATKTPATRRGCASRYHDSKSSSITALVSHETRQLLGPIEHDQVTRRDEQVILAAEEQGLGPALLPGPRESACLDFAGPR